MTRPSFLEGAALALAASIGGSVLYSGLEYLLGPSLAARLLIAALGLAYLLYVLVRSEARVGRLVSLAAWLLLAVAAWLLSLPLSLYLLTHVGAVWLLRALYFYPSPLPALADLGLQGLALAAALGFAPLGAFSHAAVGFGDWGFNRLDLAAPDLLIASAPAGLVPPFDVSTASTSASSSARVWS